MTTLAYRDGVLAADRQMILGDWRVAGDASKIVRGRDGALFGCTGDYAVGMRFRRWFEGSRKDDPPATGQDTRCVIVEADGRVVIFECDSFFEAEAPFYAWGSGMPAALAAMHMGASAERAVEIAALLDPGTGGGVDVLRLTTPSADKVAADLGRAITREHLVDAVTTAITDGERRFAEHRLRRFDDEHRRSTRDAVEPSENPDRAA